MTCTQCNKPEYAHGLCHRHWARQGLELDTDQKPLTTPPVASGAKQKRPWGSRQVSQVQTNQEGNER